MSVQCIHGDCLEVLRGMPDSSIDSIVTDPPYHLTTGKKGGTGQASVNLESPYGRARIGTGFMGMKWDGGDIAQRVELWAEALRVLKPGGHLLAFSGSRTYHRMAVAIEDAGFELRDQIMWVYGSGFPKSHNGEWGGTALKPAHEPIAMARKPLQGTVEQNWKAFGTGALNIDGCRVATNGEGIVAFERVAGDRPRDQYRTGTGINRRVEESAGRWPANLIHDGSEEVVAQFPAEAGAQAPVFKRNGDKFRNSYGSFAGNVDEAGATFQGDQGSAARFFYCAKASRADRNEGLPSGDTPAVVTNATMRVLESANWKERNGNFHPTVKPTDLMRYLCRLVTPPGGKVLDLFMGSGSTGKAAVLEGFEFVGIELDADYIGIAKERIAHAQRLVADAANDAASAAAQGSLFGDAA